jgi:acyl carrier protein
MGEDGAKDKIRVFLRSHISREITDDTDLFGSGLVSSLFAMQLVLFVEKEFGIKVENEDLDLVNFHSVNALDEFIARKWKS